MPTGLNKSREELPWLYYPRSNSVRIINSHLNGGGGASYDSDAQDYFTRAEGLGGSFNLTAINGTYTESYVKSAIDDFVTGLKTDSIWSKIDELYLLSCVTFDGLTAKLKHSGTSTLTNTNFVSGDYLAAGASAGVTGAHTKRFDTSCNPSAWSEATLGFYHTAVAWNVGSDRIIGCFSSGSSRIDCREDDVDLDIRTGLHILSASASAGLVSFSTKSGSGIAVRNGVQTSTSTATGTPGFPNLSIYLMDTNGLSGVNPSTQSFAFCSSTWLTLAEQQSLHSRVNTLMTAIGANTY